MTKLPVALQVYSVRDDAAADLENTLRKIKEMGYDGVEFAGLYGYEPDTVKNLCREVGLVPISAHVPFVDLMADTEGLMEAYSRIGCRYIAIPYLTEEYRPGTPRFSEVIEGAKKIGACAKKHGIQLLYHNHDFEFTKIDGRYALDILYSEVDAGTLQTELDTCWVNVGGEDPVAYLEKYSGRAPVVHLKDFHGEKSRNMYQLIGIDEKKQAEENTAEKFEFRPVGYGKQDIPAIITASERAGAQWLVVEQDMPSMGKTPLECAKTIQNVCHDEFLLSIF